VNALADWIRNWGHWIVFLLLEVTSLVLLFRFNNYQGSVWFTQANLVSGTVLDWQSRLVAYTRLGEVNRQLTVTNLVLQSEVDILRHRLAEYEHDSTLTERTLAAQLAGVRRIPARVIDNSIRDRDNYITIDRGSADGIHNEMGVVCGTGIASVAASRIPNTLAI